MNDWPPRTWGRAAGVAGIVFTLTNDREGDYGGSFENRTRFLLETIAAARAVWPCDLPVFVRISSTDWVEGGWTLEDSIALCRVLKAKGNVDLIDCSTGGPCRAGENFARRSGMGR